MSRVEGRGVVQTANVLRSLEAGEAISISAQHDDRDPIDVQSASAFFEFVGPFE